MRYIYIIVFSLSFISFPIYLIHVANTSSNTEFDAVGCGDAYNKEICTVFEKILMPIYVIDDYININNGEFKKLPILYLNINDGAVRKIEKIRQDVLKFDEPIYFSSSDHWVKASAMYLNNSLESKSKVKLRLKGDWGDHLTNKDRLSFRIKVIDDSYVNGMKVFSVQAPKTRNFHNEKILLDEMRQEGILAPKYFFVNLIINGKPLGVMAVEEFPVKEMLESQSRRDSAVVSLDEDPVWRQRFINLNVDKVSMDVDGAHPHSGNFGLRDLAVKQMNSSKISKMDLTEKSQYIASSALLRDYLDGKFSASKVFDIETTAKWFTLTNVWGACHGAIFHNRRFYYNPILHQFEPISFDNHSDVGKYSYCNDFSSEKLINNVKYQQLVLNYANILKNKYSKESVIKEFFDEQELMLSIKSEGLIAAFDIVDYSKLVSNVDLFIEDFLENVSKPTNRDSFSTTDVVRGQSLILADKKLNSHIRAFQYKGSENRINIKNISGEDIYIESVSYFDEKNIETTKNIDFTLSSFKDSTSPVYILKSPYSSEKKSFINYNYKNLQYREQLIVQYSDFNSGYTDISGLSLSNYFEYIEFDESSGILNIGPGVIVFEENYNLFDISSISIHEGTDVYFKNGASLYVRSPINAIGTMISPINIFIEPKLSINKLGSYGGLAIVNAPQKTIFKYTNFIGEIQNYSGYRQDIFGMTGCVNLYNSNVEFKFVKFEDLTCEDSLNVIASEVTIENTRFINSFADSLDMDFSSGTVLSSIFDNSGNDGVDISGTNLTVRDSSFYSNGDKSISVGEESLFFGVNLKISGSPIGIAVKDKSTAEVLNTEFFDISDSAISAFVKKAEYGPSKITCIDCEFDSNINIARSLNGSTIIIQ